MVSGVRAHLLRRGSAALGGLLISCALPGAAATGLELTWSFHETQTGDGADALRSRTCRGAGITHLRMEVSDLEDSSRGDAFTFRCEPGLEADAPSVPEDFLELRPGSYHAVLEAIDEFGESRLRAEQSVDVHDGRPTPLSWRLPLPTVNARMDLGDLAGCAQLRLLLLQRADGVVDASSEEQNDLYRTSLRTSTGLSLAGLTHECADIGNSLHPIEAIDIGEYLLEIHTDQVVCAQPVSITERDSTIVVDLASAICSG